MLLCLKHCDATKYCGRGVFIMAGVLKIPHKDNEFSQQRKVRTSLRSQCKSKHTNIKTYVYVYTCA